VKRLWRALDDRHPLANLAPTEPGIDEDPRFVSLQIGTIAVGAAAENGETRWHGEKL
jgi:hypothetical protein